MSGAVILGFLSALALIISGAFLQANSILRALALAVAGVIGIAVACTFAYNDGVGVIGHDVRTLSECGLSEGVVYRLESEIEHQNSESLIVVRGGSDGTHRACLVEAMDVPSEYFVVVGGQSVMAVADGLSYIGDTEEEAITRGQRSLNFYVEPIIVTGERQ